MRSARFLVAGLLLLCMIVARAPAAGAEELKPGDPAPGFTLQGSDGKKYSLEDYRGKKVVVLAWFPKAFTPGCTQECKSLGAQDAPVKQYDVAYFTASVDDREANRKFAESLGVSFPILRRRVTIT